MKQIPIIMPQLGESIAEATIINFLIDAGDEVAPDQDIIEVETNKATMNISSPGGGIVRKLTAKLNESYPVGAVLGYIEVSIEEARRVGLDKPEPEQAQTPGKGGSDVKTGDTDRKRKVEPTVRGLPVPAYAAGASYMSPRMKARMNELGLHAADLAGVAGSGAAGRVTIQDFERFLASLEKSKLTNASTMRVAVADAMRRSWTRPLATVALLTGYREIRTRRILHHRAAMVGAFFFSSIFLVSYLVNFTLHGETHFNRFNPWWGFYWKLLASHIVLSMIALPLILERSRVLVGRKRLNLQVHLRQRCRQRIHLRRHRRSRLVQRRRLLIQTRGNARDVPSQRGRGGKHLLAQRIAGRVRLQLRKRVEKARDIGANISRCTRSGGHRKAALDGVERCQQRARRGTGLRLLLETLVQHIVPLRNSARHRHAGAIGHAVEIDRLILLPVRHLARIRGIRCIGHIVGHHIQGRLVRVQRRVDQAQR